MTDDAEHGKMVELYSTDNQIEADLFRNVLESEGIHCVIDGETQAGLTGLGFIPIRLFVRPDDHEKARNLIDNIKHD